MERLERDRRTHCRGAIALAVLLGVLASSPARGQDRSPIVLNCDGGGTTIVKDFPDGSQFQVQQLWTNNSVNGIQSFPGGTFAFVNCTPTERNNEDVTLSCSVFDQVLGRWGEPPILNTVGLDFLDGDFSNPFNSLFSWTGEYLTLFDVGEESYSFRIRFVDAVRTAGSFPVLVGTSNPPAQSFMLRNTDIPDGTTEATNVSVGLQFGDLCVDLDLNAVAPGGTLAGTFGARQLNDDGSCGATVVEDRSAALIPAGGAGAAGAACAYVVSEPGECNPAGFLSEGTRVCLPCTGTCREFQGDLDLVFGDPLYIYCTDVVVERATGECSRACDGERAVSLVADQRTSAAAAAAVAAAAR
jgi:hypothetical protein